MANAPDKASDAIQLLMENTAAGFYSQIRYCKESSGEVSDRVVEPRRLVDAYDGLQVRALQIHPASGLRCFKSKCISSVSRDSRPIPRTARDRNTFCSGEVVEAKSKSKQGSVPGVALRLELADPVQPAWLEGWFNVYCSLVRDAVLDLTIDADELLELQLAQSELGLTDGQLRAVHAYVFAQNLMAYTIDGDYSEKDGDNIAQLNDCLRTLGWAPGG